MKQPKRKDRLGESFYNRPTVTVAQELLGKVLWRRWGDAWIGGIIVETEAYLFIDDPACHASRGKTTSNASMFARAGTLYVYPIHAKHCLNAVTEAEGNGSAVLIRAIEPVWGIEVMKSARGLDDLRRLTRGPGMLCQALGINRQLDGIDLTRHREVLIAETTMAAPFQIVSTPRIGISKAKQAMLRFHVLGNRFVSGRAMGT